MNEAKVSVGTATQIIFLFAEYDTYVQNLSESQFRRACTEDLFRAEAVELVRTSNKSIPEIAFELGISDQTLRDWLKRADIDAGRDSREPSRPRSGRNCADSGERTRSCAKSGRFKKAATFFAKETS
jgi:transposase-like protein